MSIDINSVRSPKEFEEIDNSIFIPNIGESDVKHQDQELKLKPQNYFQIVLDDKLVKSKYVANFLNSEIGKFNRALMKSGGFIPKINKSSVNRRFVWKKIQPYAFYCSFRNSSCE